MDKIINIQEKIKKNWIKKLQIKEYLPIHIVQITEINKRDMIKWNSDRKCWEIFLNKDSGEMVIAHELGHLYFPKQVNDPRLLPKIAKPKRKKELNIMIHHLLNPLVDNFVDHHLLEINDYYILWIEQKKKNLENGIYNYGLKSIDMIIADFMCEYLNCHYILKEEDYLQWYSKIEGILKQIEEILLKKTFTEENLNFVKKKLNQFEKFRGIKDSEKILLFFHEIITEIGRIIEFLHWNEDIISKQFDIIFNFSIQEQKIDKEIEMH